MGRIFKILKRLIGRFFYLRRIKKSVESRENLRIALKGTQLPKLSIGAGSYVNGLKIYCWDPRMEIAIGRYCSLADEVTIVAGGEHETDWVSTYPFIDRWKITALETMKKPRFKGAVTIGNDVWIGHGVTILSGVTIGNGAVIAAGSLLTKPVEPYSVVGGVPAKPIRKRFDDETIARLQKTKWWDWDREKIKKHLEDFNSVETFLHQAEKGQHPSG